MVTVDASSEITYYMRIILSLNYHLQFADGVSQPFFIRGFHYSFSHVTEVDLGEAVATLCTVLEECVH